MTIIRILTANALEHVTSDPPTGYSDDVQKWASEETSATETATTETANDDENAASTIHLPPCNVRLLPRPSDIVRRHRRCNVCRQAYTGIRKPCGQPCGIAMNDNEASSVMAENVFLCSMCPQTFDSIRKLEWHVCGVKEGIAKNDGSGDEASIMSPKG